MTPSGAGAGAAGLRGGSRGRDLRVPGGESSDSGVQPAGSESGVPAGQQRLAGRRGLGATQRAQHTLTHTNTQEYTDSRVWFTTSTHRKYCTVTGPKACWENDSERWSLKMEASTRLIHPKISKQVQNMVTFGCFL